VRERAFPWPVAALIRRGAVRQTASVISVDQYIATRIARRVSSAKRFQRRRSSCRLSTTRSIIDELVERADASRATRMTRTRPPRHVDDED
jgi:hypothetical protein